MVSKPNISKRPGAEWCVWYIDTESNEYFSMSIWGSSSIQDAYAEYDSNINIFSESASLTQRLPDGSTEEIENPFFGETVTTELVAIFRNDGALEHVKFGTEVSFQNPGYLITTINVATGEVTAWKIVDTYVTKLITQLINSDLEVLGMVKLGLTENDIERFSGS